jgi:predicted RNase H-like nuclease (RuvC/YqgF family)
LTEENEKLKGEIKALQDELHEKGEQVKASNQELKDVVKLRANIEKLNAERETVRTQVEELIRDLEAVEL